MYIALLWQFHVCVIIQALVHGCATKLASTSLYGVRILLFYCARDMKPGYASLELIAQAKQKKRRDK